MLKIDNLHAYYGKSHVLHGVSLEVGKGEIVALLGRNGSGRSTTAKAIMGLVDSTGRIEWRGQEILGKKPFEIAHLGIGHVPENRDIFPKLTVHQNLLLGQKGSGKGSRWSFDDMYTMFPRLKERQHTEAGVLSGGEQQMLTLCRTLMGDPDLIIIDEPTEGLAPKIVELVGQYLQECLKLAFPQLPGCKVLAIQWVAAGKFSQCGFSDPKLSEHHMTQMIPLVRARRCR